MKIQQIVLSVVLFVFTAYTAWIVWQFGYTSVFEVTLREHPSTQVLLDLYIAGSILLYVAILDNKRRGRSFMKVAPFVVMTLFFGAIGLMLYFIFYPQLLMAEEK